MPGRDEDRRFWAHTEAGAERCEAAHRGSDHRKYRHLDGDVVLDWVQRRRVNIELESKTRSPGYSMRPTEYPRVAYVRGASVTPRHHFGVVHPENLRCDPRADSRTPDMAGS